MKRNVKREIECLQRMEQLSAVYEQLLEFLLVENLIDSEEARTIRNSSEQVKLLQAKLSTLSESRKLQLLEYEWTILPTERLRLTLVTDASHREFLTEV